MSERISHHAQGCYVSTASATYPYHCGKCKGLDGKPRDRRVAKAEKRDADPNKLVTFQCGCVRKNPPYLQTVSCRDERQRQRRGASQGETTIISSYTCNGSPRGCERERFGQCTYHDSPAPPAAVESAAPKASKSDQIAIRAIEFLDSDEYEGDSDFSADSACQFAAAFAERELARELSSSPVSKLVEALRKWEHWYSVDSTEFNREVAREAGLQALAAHDQLLPTPGATSEDADFRNKFIGEWPDETLGPSKNSLDGNEKGEV